MDPGAPPVETATESVDPVSWYAYHVPHQLFVRFPSSRLSNSVKVGGGVGVKVLVGVAEGVTVGV